MEQNMFTDVNLEQISRWVSTAFLVRSWGRFRLLQVLSLAGDGPLWAKIWSCLNIGNLSHFSLGIKIPEIFQSALWNLFFFFPGLKKHEMANTNQNNCPVIAQHVMELTTQNHVVLKCEKLYRFLSLSPSAWSQSCQSHPISSQSNQLAL